MKNFFFCRKGYERLSALKSLDEGAEVYRQGVTKEITDLSPVKETAKA